MVHGPEDRRLRAARCDVGRTVHCNRVKKNFTAAPSALPLFPPNRQAELVRPGAQRAYANGGVRPNAANVFLG